MLVKTEYLQQHLKIQMELNILVMLDIYVRTVTR